MSSDPTPPNRKPTLFGRPAAAAFLAVLAFVLLGANFLTGGLGTDGPGSTAEVASAETGSKSAGVLTVAIEPAKSTRSATVEATPDYEAAVENLEVTTREFAAEQKKMRILRQFRPLPGGVEMAQLEQIASCESGGDPEVVSSNGLYHGKYQFHPDTWASVGGKGLPSDAPEVEQDYRAALLLARSGPGQWPVCGA